MTQFVNDSGEYLDFIGDVGLTKQAANFFEFKIKGDVSVSLKLPNNSVNRKALGFYGAQQISSPAFSRVPFSMVKDGNIISKGNIVIQDADDEISCFYISGNSNWFQSFQFNLKEIQFDDKYTVLTTDLDDRKSATDGIIFPLVDWWANGKRGAERYLSVRNYPSPEAWGLMEIHPCLYLHTIVSEMSRHAGFVISGDLMTDALYKKIIITPTGPDYYVPDTLINRNWIRIAANQGVIYNFASDPQVVQLGSFIDGGDQFQYSGSPNYSFTATVTGTYKVDIEIAVLPSGAYDIFLYKNGVSFATVSTGNVDFKSLTKYVNLRAGDFLQLYVDNAAAANYRMNGANGKRTTMQIKLEKKIGVTSDFNFLSDSDGYVVPSGIVPDMKAVDLIKFLATFFGCVVTFDEYSRTISLNKLTNFKKEEAENWSDYFVSSREEYKTGAARLNYIQTPDAPEEQILAYNEQSNVSYGGGTIETDFDAKEENTLFELPFSGSWDEQNQSQSGMFWPYIKFYELELIESVAYSGVATAGGGLFSQFTASFQDAVDLSSTVFFVNSASGEYTGFYPGYAMATATTNPQLFIHFGSTDTGTIVAYKLSKTDGPNRMLICNAGQAITAVGGVTDIALYRNQTLLDTLTTIPVSWYDKQIIGSVPIDSDAESLAINSFRPHSHTISERYFGPIKNVFNNPKIEAQFRLPLAVFQNFDFTSYIYVKTKDLTGYFLVQKIENYKDGVTPVKVDLLYADG